MRLIKSYRVIALGGARGGKTLDINLERKGVKTALFRISQAFDEVV